MKRRNLGYRVLTGKTSVATKNYKVPQDIPSQRLHQWSVASSKNSWGTLIHVPASASFVKSFSNFSFVMLAFHTMSPNFRHATMCDKTFLCFNADQKFYVSVLDTRWFHIFTIMSNALTNTGVQMSCWDPNSNSSRYRLRSEISGSHGGAVVIYLFFFDNYIYKCNIVWSFPQLITLSNTPPTQTEPILHGKDIIGSSQRENWS